MKNYLVFLCFIFLLLSCERKNESSESYIVDDTITNSINSELTINNSDIDLESVRFHDKDQNLITLENFVDTTKYLSKMNLFTSYSKTDNPFWDKTSCCDVFEYVGWEQLPFPPYVFGLQYYIDYYQEDYANEYYRQMYLYQKDAGGDWVNNWVSAKIWDAIDECEKDLILNTLITFSDGTIGCPMEQKKIIIERHYIDLDDGVDRICHSKEYVFYFPGYDWSNPCF